MKRERERNMQRAREGAIRIKTFTSRGRERYVEEKLKTVRERERERDVEGLGMRVETCQVCIEREKKSCVVVRPLPG